ncbi:receptor-type tyrosine-protein phosphatase alpha-like [Mytilus californianus]|uniref:receptor-type tyrosine-protein phosphatase alpha-like n=1 Tax=Mytilus californianus TaxID=6549 RepID=UPI002246A787|nr:receptor-type tyrosine-protein phosphatase alpha-like [Mytilus californianus]
MKLPQLSIPNTLFLAAIGSDVVLTCSVVQTRPQTKHVWWVKLNNERQINVSDSNLKKYQGGTLQNPSLKILDVTYDDSAEYRCYGRNTNGHNYAATHLITGYKPIISTANANALAELHTEAILNITVNQTFTNITSLKWSKEGYDIDKNKRFTGGTTSLTIRDVELADRGKYVCRVDNVIGSSNVSINLITWRRPKLSLPVKYENRIGSDAELTCYIYRSSPDIHNIVWKKGPTSTTGQVEISNSDRYVLSFHYGATSRSLLRIKSITNEDADIYSCIAQNKYSEEKKSTTLFVGSPPLVKISQGYHIIRVGCNVTISVIVRNAHPGSIMEWKQGTTDISNSTRKTFGSINNPFLTIRNVEPKDAGNYSLYVKNSYGDHGDSTTLKVVSATIRGDLKLIRTANESITIQCEVSGGSQVIWRQNGEQIKIVSQQSLHIKKLTRFDKGNYTCETSLETVTALSNILQLKVKDNPLVSTPNEMFEINKGLDLVLPCPHESYPTPTNVSWTRNGVRISVPSSTKYNGSTIGRPALIIYGTKESDSGTYVCSVSNSIGTGYSKPLQLQIRGPVKQTSLAGAVAGSVVAIVVVVVLIVIFIWRRRQQLPGKTKRSTDKVSMNRGRDDSAIGLHFNVRPMSSAAADDCKLSTIPVVAADAEYYNVSDVTSTCIRVEDLKKYIQKRQKHEELKNEYKSIPNVAEHPTTHAQSEDNMPKNRFKTTFPYDRTRVILKSDGGSDYINANYIDGFEKERCYIACQGPIKTTVGDHWKMIWQENIDQIVMLTNLVEGIKNKCVQYWPAGGKQMVHGNLSLRLNVEKERTAYVTREITIEDKKSGKKRKVTQYHFTAWPDHGTPDPLYLVLFHRHVISDTKAGHSGPLLVHCSAGIGRTGTYIALDALLEEGRTTKFLDIFKFLKKMRYSRMNMIQTSDQYVCLHYALLEAFTMKETKIRKDKFSEVWQSILTDHRPLNHQRLNKEFKELEQHVGEIKGLSSSMLKATKGDQNHNQYNAAMSTTNLAKNRNKEVLPMDDKRVFLVSYGKGRSDYINAVQVPSYTKFVGYITTQLPLLDTKEDFWTMIRDHSSSTIVLIINNANEADMVYSQSGDNFTIGQFRIKISAREGVENDITKATMVLSKKEDKPRQVVLYQAICSSIPDPAVLCKLADLISTRATMSSDPITVVSSDGAKNCGLFCAFTNAVSSMQIDNNADIFQLVRLLQLRRPEFFTYFEEYKRCYEALHVHLESANVYANF